MQAIASDNYALAVQMSVWPYTTRTNNINASSKSSMIRYETERNRNDRSKKGSEDNIIYNG
jgi:hypothetical protein